MEGVKNHGKEIIKGFKFKKDVKRQKMNGVVEKALNSMKKK